MTPKPVAGDAVLSFREGGPGRLSVLPIAPRPPVVGAASRILEHRAVGYHYMHLELESPEIASVALPGQFVMLTAATGGSPVRSRLPRYGGARPRSPTGRGTGLKHPTVWVRITPGAPPVAAVASRA